LITGILIFVESYAWCSVYCNGT